MDKVSENIEKMMKPYRQMAKMTEPLRLLQKQMDSQRNAWQKAIEPTLKLQQEATAKFQQRLKEPLEQFQRSFENINKIYSTIPTISKFENPFLDHLQVFEEIGERLKEYNKKTPEYFLLIAHHGWFIDLTDSELSFPSTIAYHLKANEVEIADELLTEYYKTNLKKVFDLLISRHQNRKDILEEIKLSFEQKKYNLLIPSVLTQVDGICFDFTKKKFFIKERKNNYLPQVTAELEKSAESFMGLYLSPIQNQIPIMVREKDISNFPCNLNRHEILHGISTNYGTEINSLKVISLLKYVSDLLTDLDNKTLSTTN